MRLSDLLRPTDVVIGLQAAGIGMAAGILLHHTLAARGFHPDEIDRLVRAVLAREKEAPTLCGPIAIPHARDAQIASFLAAVGVNPAGVTSTPAAPRVMIAVLSPEAQRTEHLALLASIARLSRERDAVEALATATTEDAIVQIVAGVK
jgi:mannitol/fructose-specific phosphotransferase system IIA component (Ntr-type)